jgi:hypothetical protein
MAGEEITLYIFISGGFGDEISRRKSSGDGFGADRRDFSEYVWCA